MAASLPAQYLDDATAQQLESGQRDVDSFRSTVVMTHRMLPFPQGRVLDECGICCGKLREQKTKLGLSYDDDVDKPQRLMAHTAICECRFHASCLSGLCHSAVGDCECPECGVYWFSAAMSGTMPKARQRIDMIKAGFFDQRAVVQQGFGLGNIRVNASHLKELILLVAYLLQDEPVLYSFYAQPCEAVTNFAASPLGRRAIVSLIRRVASMDDWTVASREVLRREPSHIAQSIGQPANLVVINMVRDLLRLAIGIYQGELGLATPNAGGIWTAGRRLDGSRIP